MTKRNSILGEVLNALQGITIANEFGTDLGNVVELWRGIPIEVEPGTIAAELRDVREEQDEKPSSYHNRQLTLELHCLAAMGADSLSTVREMIGDVEYCLGEYRRNGSALVFNVQLMSNDLGTEQKKTFVAFARVTFRVSYRTASFNPDA
jgi:hypothetical protein